jgi:hypothetical protein
MKEVEEALRTAGVRGRAEVLVGEGQYATVGGVVDGAVAIEVWWRLKQLLPPLGFWPVVLAEADDVAGLRDSWAGPPSVVLEKGASLQPEIWLQERAASDPEYYEPIHGSWPSSIEPHGFVIHTDTLSGHPLPEVYIGAVPTSNSWEVFAYLAYGDWNECPSPHEHVAMFKYWFNRYEAEVLGISTDTIECTVFRPPTTRDGALALAQEQFIYCTDIVGQGTQTLENLAALLLDGQNWFFWWD